jgi:hypothetical protein
MNNLRRIINFIHHCRMYGIVCGSSGRKRDILEDLENRRASSRSSRGKFPLVGQMKEKKRVRGQ